MDIKDLFAKITGKNKEAASGSSRRGNSVSMFFERNPKMKFIIAIIAIIVIIFFLILSPNSHI